MVWRLGSPSAPPRSYRPRPSDGRSTPTDGFTFDHSSGGDTLLFPIYTAAITELDQDKAATTSFSVTNTSATQTIAAKIRFREQERSMDVLDFIVVFSPNDKFDFSVTSNLATTGRR